MLREDADATIPLAGLRFDAARLELRNAHGQLVSLRTQALAVLGCLACQREHVVQPR